VSKLRNATPHTLNFGASETQHLPPEPDFARLSLLGAGDRVEPMLKNEISLLTETRTDTHSQNKGATWRREGRGGFKNRCLSPIIHPF
jgi:hypothetical protein